MRPLAKPERPDEPDQGRRGRSLAGWTDVQSAFAFAQSLDARLKFSFLNYALKHVYLLIVYLY